MNTTLTLNGHPIRPTALLAVLGLAATTHADLKMTATVTSTDSETSHGGIPAPGTYEVDFRSTLARIVKPDGSILIFDFNASQVAFLNTTKKTYFVQAIDKTLKARTGPAASATFSADTSASTKTLFGVTASEYNIATQFALSPLVSNAGFNGGRSNFENALYIQRGTSQSSSRSTNQQQAASNNQGSQGNINGTAWIADGSGEKTTISSVAPLVLIGAPHALAYSLTETLDQKAGLPLAFSFSWSNGKGGNDSVAMTVSAVSQTTLADTTFTIPSDYKLVTKG
jgi:hypothetical protein